MTSEEFVKKMSDIQKESCLEKRHIAADMLMCHLLCSLGYKDGVAIFNAMDKWYD